MRRESHQTALRKIAPPPTEESSLWRNCLPLVTVNFYLSLPFFPSLALPSFPNRFPSSNLHFTLFGFPNFLCPSNHAGSLHLPRRSAFFRTIFPRFLLLLFRDLRLATRSESFEIIAVTNDTVVNWNRLRNSIALWRGRGNE